MDMTECPWDDTGHPRDEFYICVLHSKVYSIEYVEGLELASDLAVQERHRLEHRVDDLKAVVDGVDNALQDMANAGVPVVRVPSDLSQSVVRSLGALHAQRLHERAEWRKSLAEAVPEAARLELEARQRGLDAARQASTKLRNACAMAVISRTPLDQQWVLGLLNALDNELNAAREA
jgi:phosphoglycolate phosphatase-like HAD superfamily hydrolase